MARKRSLAEIVGQEFRLHQKDCTLYRKRTAKVLETMVRRQDEMHIENKSERKAEFDNIRADIADIRRDEASKKAARQKWMIRGQRALIALLFTGLVYTVWHIITHTNVIGYP